MRLCGAAAAAWFFVLLASPTRAAAATWQGGFCSSAHAQAAAPPGVTIANIPDLYTTKLPATTGGVALIPAGDFGTGSPEMCLITGTVVTNPADGKTANFGAVLPLPGAWNGKFMFDGCGGNCGTVILVPTVTALQKGYPVWATDDGHQASNVAWPIVRTGVADEDTIVDYAYRAVHTAVADGKQFTLHFYDAAKLSRAYYEGCSDGGREGMVEANRYPDDFDGVLAGDPYFDVPGEQSNLADVTVQFQLKTAHLTPALLAIASKVVTDKCDAVDGVKDGLIQNPALCRFDPEIDLPKCRNDISRSDCFTLGQRRALSTILAALVDSAGRVVHPGFTPSNMNSGPGLNLSAFVVGSPPTNTGIQPWPNYVGAPFVWTLFDPDFRYWAYRGVPGYDSFTTPGFTYRRGGPGPIDVFHTVIPDGTLDTLYRTTNIASGDFPAQLEPFVSHGHKLLLFHGYSDGYITPYTTIQYYARLATLTNGGYVALQRNVRLFMVPGMYHCFGGPGPNNFGQAVSILNAVPPGVIDDVHDATTALEHWVEGGKAPDHLIATKFLNDVPAQGAVRSMPLCPFPAEAKYVSGNVNDAASWKCLRNDTSLFAIGHDGFEAGLSAPLYRPREDEAP